MKKIVISGYYGFDNLGDEAILAGIISLLKKKNKELKITVLSASPEQSAERYGVEAVSRTSIPKILALLKEADLFISGGGSLLQDVTGSASVPYYLGLFWLAKMQKCKTAFYAQGVGPLNKGWSRLFTAFSLNRFDFIGVRDQKSKELLKEIGVKKEIIETVDPVFALYERENVVRQKIKGELKIGVSVRPWSTDYLAELAKGLNNFAREYKVSYQLFAMHKGSDEKMAAELKELLETDSDIIELPAEPKAALKKFALLDLFLGVRLHSLIFALINQIPSLALSYDPKIEGLIDPISYLPLLKLEGLQGEEVEQELEALLSERYTVRKKLWDYALEKKKAAEDFRELLFKEVSL